MSEQLFSDTKENLQKYWGFSSFRPGQDQAVKSVLNGHDTMVLFPTGGGKSICYQLPATVLDGLTLVISPLVALMQDQVTQLNERGIPATCINSTISRREVEQRLVNARNGMYRLLYCAPERLATDLWKAEMANLDIRLIAIDEAHCISEWGHDFRPEYRKIRPSLEPVGDSAGWIALTATATPEVREDIRRNLEFENPTIISRGFERPNLKWWVVETTRKEQKLLKAVRKAAEKGSGLIYGGTRRNCEALADTIEQKLGIKTKAYHAGVDPVKRSQIQKEWIEGQIPLVVATTAFGMGIDKADCRYVIHYEMPYSLEAYYQESGRAGRDGEESFPLLLFKPSDAAIAEKRIEDAYPVKEQLQHTYDALCDSFELAVGTEMEKAEEVSIRALCKRTGFKRKIVRSSLKVLSHLGIIRLMEHITPQAGVRFVVSRDYILDLIDSLRNRQKASFLDILFRQFGPESFGRMKYLELDYLRRKLNVSPNAVKKGLQVLQDHDHVLQYESIGELPLVQLIDERQRKLPLSKAELEKHRDSLLKKLEYMKGYITTDICREVYIRRYFGETDVQECGHCDNCLSVHGKSASITDEDIRDLKNMLNKNPMTFQQIRNSIAWDERKLKKSLSFLIREEKIEWESEQYRWKG